MSTQGQQKDGLLTLVLRVLEDDTQIVTALQAQQPASEPRNL
jgi:hypothetical protein